MHTGAPINPLCTMLQHSKAEWNNGQTGASVFRKKPKGAKVFRIGKGLLGYSSIIQKNWGGFNANFWCKLSQHKGGVYLD
ncbi:hypothetical protein GDO78_000786 [Eleutherodactylus coqui]|uniref:Uncharacterized protein n=1 Tax=Eleutherodactylus coqui TaxID=57060 RepID=A0A8J6KI60_ELECQ|nr:hypothetical protein GDO78_000786 [Eleutherodactylus coqui]